MTNPIINWPALLKLTNNRLELTKGLLDIFAAELFLLRSTISAAHNKIIVRILEENKKPKVHKLHVPCCYIGAPI